MKDIVKKLSKVESEIAQIKGPFHLFAFFLREDAQDKWDLIVAAPWIKRDKAAALKFIANTVQKSLQPSELIKLSRIVLVDDNNTALKAIQSAVQVKHEIAEVKDSVFFGLKIKHAFIITSNKDTHTESTVKVK